MLGEFIFYKVEAWTSRTAARAAERRARNAQARGDARMVCGDIAAARPFWAEAQEERTFSSALNLEADRAERAAEIVWKARGN